MKKKLNKLSRRARRKKQIKEGFFDGRFAPRTQDHAKNYKRKSKHKPDYEG